MTPEPRPRARQRRRRTPGMDAAETAAPLEEPGIADQPPAADQTIIETTATVISEEIEPFAPADQPADSRTDFYFPPLPRSDGQPASKTAAARRGRQRTRRASLASHTQAATRLLLRVLKGLARTVQILAVFAARAFKRATLPRLRRAWRWMVHDPYAPPRERAEHALLQGHVLGVYRYHLYQRIILAVLGGVPLGIALLYIAYLIINGLLYGVDGRLFLVQDLAGTCAGLFSSFMMLNLASTRITLRSDGIEYKTMFRVVRSRWEEISMLKVDYFRRSERWIVGTGRGAWAFLFRSLFGLPKGRQLAKLITIYARLSPTGTPYWLPSLGRSAEGRPVSRSPSQNSSAKAQAGVQQPAP